MRLLALISAAFVALAPALGSAAEPIDKAYIRSLGAPGATIVVMEYRSHQAAQVERQGYRLKTPARASSATSFAVSESLEVSLWGVRPCEGTVSSAWEGFEGSCAEFAQLQLGRLLRNSRVIYCRAFASEKEKPTQNATCFTHHVVEGAMDAVDMIEEQLVSIGALRVERDSDGAALRPDLIAGEKLGKAGAFGLWSRDEATDDGNVP
jgi:hypothetical protein